MNPIKNFPPRPPRFEPEPSRVAGVSTERAASASGDELSPASKAEQASATQARELRTRATDSIALAALTHVKAKEALGEAPYGHVEVPTGHGGTFAAAFAASVPVREDIRLTPPQLQLVRRQVELALAQDGIRVLGWGTLENPTNPSLNRTAVIVTDEKKFEAFLQSPEWKAESREGKTALATTAAAAAAVPVVGWLAGVAGFTQGARRLDYLEQGFGVSSPGERPFNATYADDASLQPPQLIPNDARVARATEAAKAVAPKMLEAREKFAKGIAELALTHLSTQRQRGASPYGEVKVRSGWSSTFETGFGAALSLPDELRLPLDDAQGMQRAAEARLAGHGIRVLGWTPKDPDGQHAEPRIIITDRKEFDAFLNSPEWKRESTLGRAKLAAGGALASAIPVLGWAVGLGALEGAVSKLKFYNEGYGHVTLSSDAELERVRENPAVGTTP